MKFHTLKNRRYLKHIGRESFLVGVWIRNRIAGDTSAFVLHGTKSPIRCLALSQDGELLAGEAEDGSVCLFDLRKKKR